MRKSFREIFVVWVVLFGLFFFTTGCYSWHRVSNSQRQRIQKELRQGQWIGTKEYGHLTVQTYKHPHVTAENRIGQTYKFNTNKIKITEISRYSHGKTAGLVIGVLFAGLLIGTTYAIVTLYNCFPNKCVTQ